MKISGTIITLNAEKYILRAVKSLKLISDEVIVDGKIDVTIYQQLARLGYMAYTQVTTLFEMKRPAV